MKYVSTEGSEKYDIKYGVLTENALRGSTTRFICNPIVDDIEADPDPDEQYHPPSCFVAGDESINDLASWRWQGRTVSEAIWGADAGRGTGKTTFCVTRSPRDGIGEMSGAFPATASGSDRVGASLCRGALFVNVADEEPKEERGSNREIGTLAATRLGFSMTSLSPRLATTSLSPRVPARLF